MTWEREGQRSTRPACRAAALASACAVLAVGCGENAGSQPGSGGVPGNGAMSGAGRGSAGSFAGVGDMGGSSPGGRAGTGGIGGAATAGAGTGNDGGAGASGVTGMAGEGGGDSGAGGADGGTSGGNGGSSGGTTAETFSCATSLFQRDGTYLAYALTLMPEGGGYVAVLRLEAPHDDPPSGPISTRSLALDGAAGRVEIDLTFVGGSLLSTALEGAAEGVLEGVARFDEDPFGSGAPAQELLMACWAEGSPTRFRYDPKSGHCLDAAGAEGRQVVPVPMLRATRKGECATVGSSAPPQAIVADSVLLNEMDVGYPVLRGWDLRGSLLTGAGLYFALLLDADLRGTDFADFFAGYHNITGVVDEHTVGPRMCDVPANGRLRCCTVGGECE